ncbi:MAG: hypothetical protein H3C31_06570 [Brumimicrobium sp.]|nr:hypothetical protein [Brumimicrobium sp.]MCO5268451.1 hypothetical protein [Brumimicrobium sp.]
MIKKTFFRIALISFLLQGYSVKAQESIVEQISLLTTLEADEILAVSPHFPLRTMDNEQFKAELKTWYNDYRAEYEQFIKLEKFQQNPFYWNSFGLEVEEEVVNEYLNDDLLTWIAINSISNEELRQAAPHFPSIPNSGNKREDANQFSYLKVTWLKEYREEFDAIIRIVDPNYNMEPMVGPYFTSYRPGTEKPMLSLDDANNPDRKLIYDMKLQHWYYMHNQTKYRELYGEPPALPEQYGSMEEYIKENTKNDN